METSSNLMLAGTIFVSIGSLGATIGTIWFLIVAFRQSIGWGLGSMFVPFVGLFFAIKYWNDAQTPFILSLMGTIIALIGAAYFFFAFAPLFAPPMY